ncbi:MAG: hypothetical protein ACI4P4_15940, partial [Faecousia sp.]
MDEFRKTVQKNSLYDDRSSGIRWRFPNQCAHWFGMTRSNGLQNSQFVGQLIQTDKHIVQKKGRASEKRKRAADCICSLMVRLQSEPV